MKDHLVGTALRGTRQQDRVELPMAAPLSALFKYLPSEMAYERKLLLLAGVREIYEMAGAASIFLDIADKPAPPEKLAECSPELALMIRLMLEGSFTECLPEAVEQLQHKGQRLPPALLPLALTATPEALQPAMRWLLGERGAWLTRFLSAWSWARIATINEDGTLTPEAEATWREGTVKERLDLLRRLRFRDPAQARRRLQEVWSREKADVRLQFLTLLSSGLSADDEDFLEDALSDRSPQVRRMATSLLMTLPDSRCRPELLAEADCLIQQEEQEGRIVFVANPPAEVPQQWQRYGIAVSSGLRHICLQQLISLVPPAHWEQRFHVSPAAFLQGAAGTWAEVALETLYKATRLYHDEAWALALW